MKIHNFRGDLTDTSAKKEALRMTINIQLLSNIWSHVELPYDIRCLILKEGLHLPCSRQQQDIISLAWFCYGSCLKTLKKTWPFEFCNGRTVLDPIKIESVPGYNSRHAHANIQQSQWLFPTKTIQAANKMSRLHEMFAEYFEPKRVIIKNDTFQNDVTLHIGYILFTWLKWLTVACMQFIMLLKGNTKQVTFLHVYHHASISTIWCEPLKLFSKFKYSIFRYFDPTNIDFDNINKYFLGWPKRYLG